MRDDRDERQYGRGGVRAGLVDVVVFLLHIKRDGLRLPDDPARYDGQRAVFAERTGQTQHDAVGKGPADARDGDTGGTRSSGLRPGVQRPVSCSWPSSWRTGTIARTTSGSDTNTVASTMPGTAKIDIWTP